jgi:putative resolvase
MKQYKLSEIATLLGLHKQTIWKYVNEGKLIANKTTTNRWYVSQDNLDLFTNQAKPNQEQGVALYARVSSSENKDDLERQVNRLVGFANAKGWRVVHIEKEIGSGVNDQRPKLLSLLKNYHKYDYIIVEHKDRLTRFGFNLIINNINNIYVINEVDNDEHGLMEDLIAIMTSFCARLYGQRRGKRKTEKLITELNENNEKD